MIFLATDFFKSPGCSNCFSKSLSSSSYDLYNLFPPFFYILSTKHSPNFSNTIYFAYSSTGLVFMSPGAQNAFLFILLLTASSVSYIKIALSGSLLDIFPSPYFNPINMWWETIIGGYFMSFLTSTYSLAKAFTFVWSTPN